MLLRPSSSSFLVPMVSFLANFLPLGVISHFTEDCTIRCPDEGHITLCKAHIWNVDDIWKYVSREYTEYSNKTYLHAIV